MLTIHQNRTKPACSEMKEPYGKGDIRDSLARRAGLRQIERVKQIRPGCHDVHRSVDHKRRRLMGTRKPCGERPRQFELFHVRYVDLIESAEPGARVILRCHRPLAVIWRVLNPGRVPMSCRKSIGQWSKASAVRTFWRGITDPLSAWWISCRGPLDLAFPAPVRRNARQRLDSRRAARQILPLGAAVLVVAVPRARTRCLWRRSSVYFHDCHSHRLSRRVAHGVDTRLAHGVRQSACRLGVDAARRSTARRAHHVGAGRAGLSRRGAHTVRRMAAGPESPRTRKRLAYAAMLAAVLLAGCGRAERERAAAFQSRRSTGSLSKVQTTSRMRSFNTVFRIDQPSFWPRRSASLNFRN